MKKVKGVFGHEVEEEVVSLSIFMFISSMPVQLMGPGPGSPWEKKREKREEGKE